MTYRQQKYSVFESFHKVQDGSPHLGKVAAVAEQSCSSYPVKNNWVLVNNTYVARPGQQTEPPKKVEVEPKTSKRPKGLLTRLTAVHLRIVDITGGAGWTAWFLRLVITAFAFNSTFGAGSC